MIQKIYIQIYKALSIGYYYQQFKPITVVFMDPTKSILDFNNDSVYNCFQKQSENRFKTSKINYQQRCNQLQQQIAVFKQQYQKLYNAYHQKEERIRQFQNLNQYIRQLQQKVSNLQKYSRITEDVKVLKDENQMLKSNLNQRNYQLKQAYQKIELYVKKFNDNGSIDFETKKIYYNIDKLQDGVKEAIHSNFELLRNNSINQIKGLVRSSRQQHTIIVNRQY